MHGRVVGLLVVVGACAAPAELSQVDQAIGACSPAICGFNSPNVNYNGFHELNKSGVPNAEGFSITGFVKDGESYKLEVTNGALSGTNRYGKQIAHQGLVGARILLSYYGKESYAIRIASVGSLRFAVAPVGNTETYVLEYGRLQYNEDPQTWTNVCGGFWNPEQYELNGDAQPLMLGQSPGDSILFDLDRVDLTKMTLNSRPDTAWFNIGCGGHTLSKLYLTRNMIPRRAPRTRGSTTNGRPP